LAPEGLRDKVFRQREFAALIGFRFLLGFLELPALLG